MTQEHRQNAADAILGRLSTELSHTVRSLQNDVHTLSGKLDVNTRAFVQGKLSATQDIDRRVAAVHDVVRYEIDKADDERELRAADQRELERQIESLGAFIIESVPGEPSQSEGAIDCAIRVMREQMRANESLRSQLERALGYEEPAPEIDGELVEHSVGE